jgi:hypothetical protein
MNYHHWITPKKFHEHLDWSGRPVHTTPFISVFDNKGKGRTAVKEYSS